MSNAPCSLQIASIYGRSKRMRWDWLLNGESRTACHRCIDAVVSLIVADDPLDSLLAQERAREHFRVSRMWGAA